MSTHTELIEEARSIGNWAQHETGPEGEGKTGPTLFARLVYALEAAEPRVLTTVAEVDAEPEETVVISEQGGAWEACDIGGARYYLEPGDEEPHGAASIAFPVTVLFTPVPTA